MTTQIRPSRPSPFSAFKATILCLLAGAACISFVGCGSDTESSTSPIGEITSSSSDEVIESSDGYAFLLTSSSEQGSSSSITPNESSSSVQSSSSEVAAVSSSSDVVAESSSSDKAESSSSETSSSSVAESSSSVESSSSEVPFSSSVVESSSSVAESSSSEIMISSSSVIESSSSDMIVGKCKTSTEDKCTYGELYDERDGQTYKTVFMGTQEWMAENLNYSDSVVSPNLQENSWCYNNDDLNCEKYGRLYSWSAAMDIPKKSCSADTISCKAYHNHRGICPNGWHLPDTTDFAELLKYVKKYSPTKYGYDLIATSETDGSNAFGYSILYTGFFYNNSNNPVFTGMSVFTYLWSSMVMATSDTHAYALLFHGMDVYEEWANMTSGNPVRCIKDN